MPKSKLKALKKKVKISNFHLRSKTASESSHRGLRVLFLGLLLLGMGQSLFFAVLPPLAREIGLSEAQTAIIFSLSAAAWIFCSPFWGRRSDVWGRRTVMVVGLAGFASSTLLIAAIIYAGLNMWISTIFILPALIVARSIFGIFGSGTMPAAQAYIADRTTRAKRAKGASMLTAAFGIGNIIGPGFAASLVVFSFLTPFVFVGILGLVAAIMIFFLVPEKHHGRFHKDKDKKNMSIFAKPLRVFLIMGTLASYAQSVLIQLSAFFFIDRLNLGNEEATQLIGVALTFMALAALFAQFVVIQRFEPPIRSLLVYGGWILVVAFGGFAFSQNFPSMVLCLGLAGLGFGLMRPGLMAAASLSVGRRHQGAAAGAINATAAIGHVINPFTGALIYTYWQAGPFLIVALLMVLFSILALFHHQIRAVGTQNLEDDTTILAPHLPMTEPQLVEPEKPIKKSKKKIDDVAKKTYGKKNSKKGKK